MRNFKILIFCFSAAVVLAILVMSGCKSTPKTDSVDSKDQKTDSELQPTPVSIAKDRVESKNIARDSIESLNIAAKGGYTADELNDLTGEKKEKTVESAPGHFYDYYLKKNKDSGKSTHVVMGFNAAPMMEVVPVFAQILDFDFVMDPRVKGVITMSIDTNLSQKELWGIFEQILWQTGSYCSMDSGVLHVLPFTDMAKEKFLAQGANPKANVTVKLFTLKNMKSKDLIERLKPFLTDGAVLIDVNEQNGVFVLESTDNMEKIEAIVRLLDVKSKYRWPKAVIKCTNIPAPKIVEELNTILPLLGFPVTAQKSTDNSSNSSSSGFATGSSSGSNQPDDTSNGAIFLKGFQRLQLIVATAANNEALEEIKKWVEVLDRSDVGEQEQVFVYNIINGRADELVNVIATIFNAQGQTLTPSANLTTGGTQGSGSSTPGSQTPSGGGASPSPSPSPSPTPSSSVATAYDVTQIQAQGQQQAAGGGGMSSGPGTGQSGVIGGTNQVQAPVSVFQVPVMVFADAVNDRLIIRTTPRTYAMIKALLNRVDTTPAQVLLEITIAEVALSSKTKLGVEVKDWFGPASEKSTIGTDYGNYESATANNNKDIGFSYLFQDGTQKKAFVQALATDGKTTMLANPEILVQNHTQASINVGDQIPIMTQSMTTATGNNAAAVNNSYTYKNTGIILSITPHVSKGGLIAIDINQQVSNILTAAPTGVPANISNSTPSFRQRVFQTSLSLPDGGTIIVGGLISEDVTDNLQTVPFFGNVPFLNRMIGNTDYQKARAEQLIMITGRIVTNTTTLEQMTERYKQAVKIIKDAASRDNVNNNIVFQADDQNNIIIK